MLLTFLTWLYCSVCLRFYDVAVGWSWVRERGCSFSEASIFCWPQRNVSSLCTGPSSEWWLATDDFIGCIPFGTIWLVTIGQSFCSCVFSQSKDPRSPLQMQALPSTSCRSSNGGPNCSQMEASANPVCATCFGLDLIGSQLYPVCGACGACAMYTVASGAYMFLIGNEWRRWW